MDFSIFSTKVCEKKVNCIGDLPRIILEYEPEPIIFPDFSEYFC